MARTSKILIAFGIFWSALTLVFDAFVFVAATRQVIALSYPSTEGTILSSKVTEGSENTHGISLTYKYALNGVEYSGTRYRYDKSSSSDSKWAYAAVAERPPGKRVQVFYNPRDPEDSVLRPGLLGSDLFMFAFMTPFNAVMLTFWWAGLTRLRRQWIKPLAGGVRISTNLRATRARLTPYSPFAVGFATAALLAFVSIFPVAFLFGGFHPEMATMLVAWTIILAGGFAIGIWYGLRVLGGRYDLVIDGLNGVLDLPATGGRKIRRRVPASEVKSAYVETVRKPSSGGEESQTTYAPTLQLGGANPGSERLVEWFDQAKAAAFVGWLREQLPRKENPPRPLAIKI